MKKTIFLFFNFKIQLYCHLKTAKSELSNIPTLYLSFEKILKEPVSECEKIFKFLSQPFNKNIVSDFVEKKISTNNTGESLDLPKDILDLEQKIEKLILA